jgi:hypothetical protein
MTWTKTFREAYMDRFPCRPESFEKDLLWRALHRRALPLAWLIMVLAPRFFDMEFRTIRYLGNACSSEEFRAELDSYRSDYRRRGGVLRNFFAVRLSGTRLIRILLETRQAREAS